MDNKSKEIIKLIENLENSESIILYNEILYLYIYFGKKFFEEEIFDDSFYFYNLAFKEKHNIYILENIIICLEKLDRINELDEIIDNIEHVGIEIYEYIGNYFYDKGNYNRALKFYNLGKSNSYEKILNCYISIGDIKTGVKKIKELIKRKDKYFIRELYQKVGDLFFFKGYYRLALDFYLLIGDRFYFKFNNNVIFCFLYLKEVDKLKEFIQKYDISNYDLEKILDNLFIQKYYEEALLFFGIVIEKMKIKSLEELFKILFILVELGKEKEIFDFLKYFDLDEFDFEELLNIVSNFLGNDMLANNLKNFRNNPDIIFDSNEILSFDNINNENLEKPKELYRISRFSNLESIIDLGILSRNLANKYLNYNNNSYSQIQDRREDLGKYNLHDYAPLFFSLYPAMIYSTQIKENIQDQIIIIFDGELLKQKGVLFSDISLAYKDKKEENIFDDISKIKNLNFEIFEQKGWEPDIDIRKKKGAEVLIKDKIDFSFAKSIICFDLGVKNKIEKILLEKGYNINVCLKNYTIDF